MKNWLKKQTILWHIFCCSNAVWPDWAFGRQKITKVAQMSGNFLGYFEKLHSYESSAASTFWATFYSNILSHWSNVNIWRQLTLCRKRLFQVFDVTGRQLFRSKTHLGGVFRFDILQNIFYVENIGGFAHGRKSLPFITLVGGTKESRAEHEVIRYLPINTCALINVD